MGNPDLIVVVNDIAIKIDGTEYANRIEAIEKAMVKFEKYMDEIDKSRIDPETGDFYESADKEWMPDFINKIQVYDLTTL